MQESGTTTAVITKADQRAIARIINNSMRVVGVFAATATPMYVAASVPSASSLAAPQIIDHTGAHHHDFASIGDVIVLNPVTTSSDDDPGASSGEMYLIGEALRRLVSDSQVFSAPIHVRALGYLMPYPAMPLPPDTPIEITDSYDTSSMWSAPVRVRSQARRVSLAPLPADLMDQ
jgi:hypothetical protein